MEKENVNIPKRPTKVERREGRLLISFVLGMVIGGVLVFYTYMQRSNTVGNIKETSEGRFKVAPPQGPPTRVRREDIVLALNAVRFSVSPIHGEIEEAERLHKRELIKHNNMVNMHGFSPDSDTCRNLALIAENLKKEIDTKRMQVGKLKEAEKSLMSALSRLRIEGDTNSVNLQANKALENARGILKDVRVDEEVLKIMSSKQNENLVDYDQVPSYQYEPRVQLSGNEKIRQSKQVKPEEELTSASLEKIILPPPVD